MYRRGRVGTEHDSRLFDLRRWCWVDGRLESMGEGCEVLWESGAGSGQGNATWTEATASL
jgi:hypothetical protein